MIRPLPLVILAISLAAQARPEAPRLRLEVVVSGESGRPVEDLSAADVDVRIGAYRLPVEAIRHVRIAGTADARDVVLLLDDLTVPPATGARVRELARRFVDRMAPGDRLAIATLDGRMMESSGDRTRLLASIDQYSGLATGVIPLDRLGSHFLELLPQLVERFPEEARRPAIVAIGSGWLFDRPIPPATIAPTVRPEWSAAMRALARRHATLYVIEPEGLNARNIGSGDTGFARDTGGLAFLNTNDFRGAVDRIMHEAGDYYEVIVADPPFGRQADLRKLDVRTLRPGIELRARRWLAGRDQ